MRRRFTRFNKEEYWKHNMALVDALKAIAVKKGVTPAQLSLAWVASLGPKVIPIPGSSYVCCGSVTVESQADLPFGTAYTAL